MFKIILLFALVSVLFAQDVNSVTCPDGQSQCPDGTTCCKLASGKYGCCPLPNAVCCNDGMHCCPSGTTCDVSHGKCNRQGLSLPWFEKLPSTPVAQEPSVSNVVCPDKQSQCPDGTTCCKLAKTKKSTVSRDDDWEDVDDDDEIDETLWERFVALSEMFPQPVRTGTSKAVIGVYRGVCGAYGATRHVAWALFSSATILIIPVLFEMERAQMEQQQLQHQRQVLLGPNTAVSGSLGPPPGGMMPAGMMPPPPTTAQ